MSELHVDVYTIFFRAAGEELGSRCVEATNPSGWSYASALRSANLNPHQYRILKAGEVLDPNHVLADKYPLRLKEEDFDQQGELHLELVRVEDLGREDRALQSDNGQVAALDSVRKNKSGNRN